jgi:hypothetical protein
MRILNELRGLIPTAGGPMVRRSARWAGAPEIEPRFLSPDDPRGRVIFTGFGRRGFAAKGKIDPEEFLPPFVYALWRSGVETRFAATPDEFRAASDGSIRPPCIVHIYAEEHETAALDRVDRLCEGAGAVFNSVATGAVVARKDETNRRLAAGGVRVPRILDRLKPGETAFSNEVGTTGAEVRLVADGGALDPARYNTELVDTRRGFRGAEYHTTVRLLCVGSRTVAAWVRARPVDQGSPSVHSRDTPVDPELIEHLHGELVAGRDAEFAALAARIATAIGPGFFAHDLLIDRTTGEILLCETGLKFHDTTYTNHLRPAAAHIPCLSKLYSPALVEASARALLAECDVAGCLGPAKAG